MENMYESMDLRFEKIANLSYLPILYHSQLFNTFLKHQKPSLPHSWSRLKQSTQIPSSIFHLSPKIN
ncbi:hypothetical protein Hanom_Chr11g00993701 [Helianthus anomalus]